MNTAMNDGNGNGNITSQACAACKFQRRKCPGDCPLAPYFPAEANQRFLSCKRLFGVSNMLRFLREVDPAEKDDTMKSLIYEAEVREKDPVHGCYGIISRLAEQVKVLQRELEFTRSLMHQQQQPQASLFVQPELAQTLLTSALPLSTAVTSYRSNSGSSLALDDPFDFDSIDHKYSLRS